METNPKRLHIVHGLMYPELRNALVRVTISFRSCFVRPTAKRECKVDEKN